MQRDPIVVLKFGSSVLTRESDVALAVHDVYRYLRQGRRVVAVVSAVGDTTDRLLASAERLGPRPEPAALAALVATGEATSAALLTLALDRAGLPAALLDPWRVGLRTEGSLLDGEPRELNRRELFRALDRHPVVVMSGFVGQDAEGRTSLLGRGGSDLTAIFTAHQVAAESCRLLKDVDGLYESDPATTLAPRRYSEVSWEDALAVGGVLVQAKAVRYAQRFGLSFEVSAPGAVSWTRVGRGPSKLEERGEERPPLRVTLLGLGTVGLGVQRHLVARSRRFEVVGVAVRDLDKHRGDGLPLDLFSTDPWQVLEIPSDLVIEAIGGERPASDLVAAALESGRDVVTANKAVIAGHGARLARLAESHGVRLLYSATVGGCVPVIESVERLAARGPIRSVEGVLNATTNFVLDQVMAGSDFDSAVRLAQENGFAEADPTFDLDGTDAAHKLVIIARKAFGVDIGFDQVNRRGIDRLDPQEVRAAYEAGGIVRLVASCRRTTHGVEAEVAPVRLPADHPLAQPRNEENRVLVQPESGMPTVVEGKGAGRWPTAESVVADVLDVYRLRRACIPEPDEGFVSAAGWESGVPIGIGAA